MNRHRVPESVVALAHADFSQVADAFANAGFSVRLPARGILQIASGAHAAAPVRLLISVGIHGDETAPIEMLGGILDALVGTPRALVPDLMVVVGNPDAIARGTRFVDADLNRMFRAARGELASSMEAARADAIMRATSAFFGVAGTPRWHLDLHTAIRPSHIPTFAVVPERVAGAARQDLLGWLGKAGIGAAILGARSAGTYSAYTAEQFDAIGATVELGQVGALGGNELSRFDSVRAAIDEFLRSGKSGTGAQTPDVFEFRQELLKHSDAFRMAFGKDTKNFSEMSPGVLIAEDGDVKYHAGDRPEYIVFPNPDVRVGLRAGITVVRPVPDGQKP